MTVTSPSPDSGSAVRLSLSNTTDMVTEQGIAKSAAVLDVVAARLGNGVTAGASFQCGGVGRYERHDRQDRVRGSTPATR